MQLCILSAGAAQGVVTALGERFRSETGCALDATFGAVGAMKEKLLAGAPADLIILTRPLIAELAAGGHVIADTSVDLGVVRTGVAVRSSDERPDVSTAGALRAALLAAEGIYFPDPERATAGIHFARVLDTLGIRTQLGPRLRTFPNGATAMRELARAAGDRPIGVTQITEINNTPGVALIGALPREFELATTYSAAICSSARAPDLARRFVALLGASDSSAIRRQAGFELR